MTVFLGINLVITPPTVSIPRLRGATSNRRISATDVQIGNHQYLPIILNNNKSSVQTVREVEKKHLSWQKWYLVVQLDKVQRIQDQVNILENLLGY